MKFKHLFSLLLFIGITSIGFTACSSNDDDEDYGTGPLAGKWEAYGTDGDSQGTATFIFKNGTVTYIEKWSEPGYNDDIETYTGPYTIENNIVSMTLTRIRENGDAWYTDHYVFKFEVNGKQLTLTANNSPTRDYWGSSPIVLTKK